MKNIVRLVSSLLLVFAVAASHAQGSAPTVRVAEGSRNFNVLPVYVAAAQGYFDAEGVKMELTTLKGGPAAANALLSGDIDIAITIVQTAMQLRSQGRNIKVISLLQDRNPCVVVVPTASSAKTLADLKGKSIGVTAIGSLTEVVLRNYLLQSGLSPSDFKIVAFGQPSTVNTAMERGDVDAIVTITPFLTNLQLNKTGKILVDFRQEVYPGQALVVRGDSLEGPKGAAIHKFVAGVKKGMAKMYSDQAAATAAAKKYFPDVDEKLLAAAVADDTVAHKMFAASLDVSNEDFTKWQSALVANKILPVTASYSDVFRFLK